MDSETLKNSKTIQSTLKFPLLYTRPKNKGKSKEVNDLELQNKKRQKNLTQQTLSDFFPLPFNKNSNKRNIEEVICSDSDSNSDLNSNTNSDDDTDSSEYEMEIDVNFPPNICDKEKKLR